MEPWLSNILNVDRAISLQFQKTLNELIETIIKPETLKRDLFFALILIVLKENDFVLKGSTKLDVVDCILAERNQGRSVYEITVILSIYEDTPAKIIVCSLNDAMLINSFVEATKETYSLCLPINQYLIISSLGIPSEYANVTELFITLKEQIVTPMKNSILNYHGIACSTLSGLPNDVLFQILLSLPLSDILNISESCKKLRNIVAEENLWSRLVRRDFPKASGNKKGDWQKTYVDSYVKKRKNKFEAGHSVRENVIDENQEWPDYLPVKESRWQIIL
ncbi:uncharacterized protein LOC113508168 [Trichoplusia ni]|uniref:Uncharacterized protein LOC113508168 n=1 Tax=Trichoplusia ni TaxID=7111 RepID=A0A7E5X2P2_TRINI|nr:uncharacterized protein LOC113508168 [Trichoplusia ni]